MNLAVPHVRQSTGYSCGPACLTAVLRYYGHRYVSERAVMRRAGTTAAGTSVAGLMGAARSYGVMPYAWQGVSYETLCRMSDLGNPIIVALQAWHDGGPPDDGYADRWQDGHFVVVTHADDNGITVMDPSLAGPRGYLEAADFQARWHDLDVDERRLLRLTIVFPAAVVRRRRAMRVAPVL